MRVLLCGAGQVGSLHAGNLVRAADASEVLIADVDAARAEALALEIGARPAPVADPFSAEPDAVVVAAATPAHAGLVRACIERAIPCFHTTSEVAFHDLVLRIFRAAGLLA